MKATLRSKYRESFVEKKRSTIVEWSDEAKSAVSEELRKEIEAETALKRALKQGTKKASGQPKKKKQGYEDHKPAADVVLPTSQDQRMVGHLFSRARRSTSQFVTEIPGVETTLPTSDEVDALMRDLRRPTKDTSHHTDDRKRLVLNWD